jgi:hypothetical protein
MHDEGAAIFLSALKLNAFFNGPDVSVNGVRPRISSSSVVTTWKRKAELTLINILTKGDTSLIRGSSALLEHLSLDFDRNFIRHKRGGRRDTEISTLYIRRRADAEGLLLGHRLNA